jgi:hypothetical protein
MLEDLRIEAFLRATIADDATVMLLNTGRLCRAGGTTADLPVVR